LRTLDGQTLAQLLDLGDGILQLVEANVQMALLLLELITFFVEESNILINAGENVNFIPQ